MRLVTDIPMGPPGREDMTGEALRAYLEGVIAVNRLIIRNQPMPWLYESGVRFKSEPSNQPYDYIPTFLRMIELGYGDCAPLCAARVAELRERCNEEAGIKIYWRPEMRPLPFHAQVRRGDGSIEDVSRILGMAGKGYE